MEQHVPDLIRTQNWQELRAALADANSSDIADLIIALPPDEEAFVFRLLPRDRAADVFSYLPPDHQEGLIESLSNEQVRSVMESLPPDDRTRLLEEMPAEVTRRLLATLSPDELKHARALLGYPEETAGRYMTPRYVIIEPEMTAAEALEHIRRTGRGMETVNVVYIVDSHGKLVDDLRLGSLVLADPRTKVIDIEDPPLVAVRATDDREEVLKSFERYDRVALPVTDADGHMLGIVTVDDMLDVAEQEATEDIQKLGGMEALDAPYLAVGPLPRRDADGDGHELLRDRDRQGGRAGALRPADHLQRRQLRLAGDVADHPLAGPARAAPPRLVARLPPRGHLRQRPRLAPRLHWLFEDRAVGAPAFHRVRPALHARGPHGVVRAHRRGDVRDAGRLHAAIRAT